MQKRCSHAGFVGLGPRKQRVAPMRCTQPGRLGMIVLRDHDQRAIRFVSHNHCSIFLSLSPAQPPRVRASALFTTRQTGVGHDLGPSRDLEFNEVA